MHYFTAICVLGNVEYIGSSAFPKSVQEKTVVALPEGNDHEKRKAVWEAAGFVHFRKLAQPGVHNTPESDDQSGFSYTLLDDYTLAVSWAGEPEPEAELVIPATAELDGVTYRVSAIAPRAFAGRSISVVSLPASMVSIGEEAFEGCAQLKKAALPEGLVSIGASAFAGSSLMEVVVPSSVTQVGERAFADCAGLSRIVVLGEPDVGASVIEGCAGVRVYAPWREDGIYAWNLGIVASGNHLVPYGLSLDPEPMRLAVGESADLFEGGACEAPEGTELSYAYSASPLAVEAGMVTGKKAGGSEVEAILSLDGLELSRASRTVEVRAATAPEESASEDEPSLPQPPITSLLPSLDGSEGEAAAAIEPRAANIAEPKAFGGCTWYIEADGTLHIDVTPGETGELGLCGLFSTPWFNYSSQITKVVFGSGVKASSSSEGMFYKCNKLTSIDFGDFDTSSCTEMDSMFSDCSALGSLNLSGFLTDSVKDYSGMFAGCSSLEELDISSLNTESAENMGAMFKGCSSLTTLDVSSLKTNSVRYMSSLFEGCSSLTELDVSSFVTDSATTSAMMFAGCSSLTSINFSGFKTSTIERMEGMFSGCSSLGALDLSSFDTSKVEYLNSMFLNCSSLKDLDISGFDSSSVTGMRNMFQGCSSLSDLKLPDGFIGAKVTDVTSMFSLCNKLATIPSNLAFGSLTIPGKCFFVSGGRLATVYEGTDPALLAYDWTADNRKFVSAAYTVTFEANDGAPAPDEQSVLEGNKVTKPTDPMKTGYVFAGWYTEAACTNLYDFGTAVTGNLTLYAKWTPVVSGTVPLALTFSVDASGGVTGASCDIVSTTAAPIKVTSIACTEEAGAQTVFPQADERRKVSFSIKPNDATAVLIAFGGELVEADLGSFTIAANSTLPLALDLVLPQGTHVSATGTESDPNAATAVAKITYTLATA